MAEAKFKLPRSSYEEICKIIKAYGRLKDPSSLDDVAKYCAMNKTAISANNAFLANIELIEGGRAKAATMKGRALAKALEHELPDEMQENWLTVVQDNEFLEKMAAAVKIRGRMESSALESHIAYSAGEAKSGPVMTGARAVVDMLRAAGVVREHDGQLVASAGTSASEQSLHSEGGALQPSGSSEQVQHEVSRQSALPSKGASVHIELRIDAKPSELDGLGEKIRKLMLEIDRPTNGEDDETTRDS
ncbi:MAG: hypothetical protein P1P84_00705 [Deferrisomatales bacterium]|nr:hypothetical protein [Deferrisomatales bacterium]